MSSDEGLLLAFYGDDFTGSTDALEFLSCAGAKTILFVEPPAPEQLRKYKDLDAIGVAGMTRAMDNDAMHKELMAAFPALKKTNARHIHYKVCSTFDSSPETGSIGKVIDIAAGIFSNDCIPLLVAAPVLGRYCAFGNLFARMGIGSNGQIYRLDRHPSMKNHPTTPADESDLRLHLARQTLKKIGLVDVLEVNLPEDELAGVYQDKVDKGAEIMLFDAMYKEQLMPIGRLIDSRTSEDRPLFSVGSSGIEMALGEHWQATGRLRKPAGWPEIDRVDQLLVVSGSCSPVTSSQISWATAHGFEAIVIDTPAISRGQDIDKMLRDYTEQVVSLLQEHKSVIVHTGCRENKDPDLVNPKTDTAKLFGSFLGKIVKETATRTGLKRIVVAGGDTSSYAARTMGIEAVEMIAPLTPGAPLCKIHAPGSPVDDLEINFKGGQVGGADYFGMLQGE
ncbi:four-carbon acid sugar kinase family protein [Sinomicrobium pectinilyticum]|uniref:Four-carbon acid sugar kinase family protein n=1 Tax=Sinomicrobium pectinilyticum TaxID=1084421 RepID=A0A3N0F2Z7_SINP1|nr:four-carbon acid sugar kinase family protein [Sinomicrobium pectinilyticum]RNL94533.1 four-carbon acid sugar kinase family protein [Sinomicrobium pectinilyticum]